jgi:CBS domain-containing protein
VRVREVTSSPVVTVPPDMPLKAVAKLLVARGISAVRRPTSPTPAG